MKKSVTRSKVERIKNLIEIRRKEPDKGKGAINKRIREILKSIPREEYELYKEKLTKIMYGNKSSRKKKG